MRVLATSEVGAIIEAATASRPALVVVDSIQTMTVEELDGPAGSVGQVKESALRLMELAKGQGIAVVLVGHVTKEGSIAGPRTLEHLVDAVIDLGGERGGVMRLLRATKNRFGSTDELGVLEMGEFGLREVADPGRAFLAEHVGAAPGSVVAATMEGSRPLLIEVQALVSQAGYSTPARRASGIDPTRLALLLAVLGRRAGVPLGSHDVYANLAGGLSVAEPGLDLASRSRSRRRSATGPSTPDRRGRARSGSWASFGPSPASTGASARPLGSGSSGPSCRQPAAARRPTCRASASCRRRTCATHSRPRSAVRRGKGTIGAARPRRRGRRPPR